MNLTHPTALPPAFIEGLGGPEAMLILLIVLLLFGGKKLPEFARGLGKSIREFKKAAAGVEEEFKRAIDEEPRAASPTPTVELVSVPAVTTVNATAVVPSTMPAEPGASVSTVTAPATAVHGQPQSR